jgi:hypothetical protein
LARFVITFVICDVITFVISDVITFVISDVICDVTSFVTVGWVSNAVELVAVNVGTPRVRRQFPLY